MTYQHGLPFNQRVERKDKVKPCSQHRHSEFSSFRGREGQAGGQQGPPRHVTDGVEKVRRSWSDLG